MTDTTPAFDTNGSRQLQIATDFGDDGMASLILVGEIDVASADDVYAVGLGVLNSSQCTTLCVDLAGVSFLDSTGLGALLKLRAAAHEAGHDVALRSQTPAISRLLQLTGLSDTFDILEVKADS
jgi:anti-sigma B factor antagonist